MEFASKKKGEQQHRSLWKSVHLKGCVPQPCCSSCLVAKQTQLVWHGLITLDEALYETINIKEGWIVNIKRTGMQR